MVKFIKPEYNLWNQEFNCADLPWCYFKVDTKTLNMNYVSKINIPLDDLVNCHDEQRKILYKTTLKKY